MKSLLFIFAVLLTSASALAQLSFSNAQIELTKKAGTTGTGITCKSGTVSLSFRFKSKAVEIIDKAGFVTVDSQVVQIALLDPIDPKKRLDSLSESEQKSFLSQYTKYELDYFKELGIEVIKPHNQWEPVGGRKWFIWYFGVGKTPVKTEQQVKIQLFASAIVGKRVLTLNAPISDVDNFEKAAKIVNEIMETLSVTK